MIARTTTDNIQLSLPEYLSILNTNPGYIQNTESDAKIVGIDSADVWVTFIHEGAGYRNVLGFYTYKSISKPTKISDIESSMTIIFPNSSYTGSGGGLTSGDKVKIGRFAPGTTIGWFVLSNGFTGSTTSVSDGVARLFSDPQLNPETDSLLGCSFNNGFGIQLSVAPGTIASVSGTRTLLTNLNANGTESRQSKAVIMILDSAKALKHSSDGSYVNTETG